MNKMRLSMWTKGNGMNIDNDMVKHLTKLGLLLMLGVCMNANAGLFGFGSTSWKEEVLLHDRSKIVVERSVDRGGRHEIGQKPPIKAQRLIFKLPTTNESVTWKTEFSEDIGLADFKPILLDIVEGKAYLVTTPMGCLAYNKWGRPNPPYVIFKYDSKEWQRITIQELPAEIKAPNLIISSPDSEVAQMGKSFITVEAVKRSNGELTQPEYKTIMREALPQGNGCSIPRDARAEPIGPVVDGKILYYNWWPLAKDWLKSKYGESK
jgi:hypothetical protein